MGTCESRHGVHGTAGHYHQPARCPSDEVSWVLENPGN